MMRRKNSPGCKCCGCVADSEHVCICTCPHAFWRTATTADTLGTHVLTYSGTASQWQAFPVVSTTTYSRFLGTCTPDGSSWQIAYRLLFDCPGANPSFPAGRWRLSIEAKIAVCSGVAYPAKFSGTEVFWSAVDDADWTCDPDAVLSFDIPANLTSSFSPGVTYPTPGGGGTLTVTFGP